MNSLTFFDPKPEINDEIQEDQSELYEHFSLRVDKGQGPVRIDRFLTARIENASRNKIQAAARVGNILVNDKPVRSNYRIKPGDQISIVLSWPPREMEILPENIPVQISYEDDDLIVVNKKAGMVVHPAFGNYTGTLVNALTYYFDHQHKVGVKATPYLVHRIDKNTSGLLIVAKNELAQSLIARELYYHRIDRRYVALVWGDFKEEKGTITGHIGRNLRDRKTMSVFPGGEHGKHAITHYRILERFRYTTLVECTLETGRTHQIRAHMKYIGHPVFNDETYGGSQILKGTTFTKYKQFIDNCFRIMPRHALHARYLGFKHPSTGKLLEFDSELPDDMALVVGKWRSYVQ
ncbi:MAG TPA: RluA family pseudouridine synthase [Bacteroidales bacterium]|nr:RluA family pseudouridine synthase [Bacteroidales bacterium]